MNKRDGSRLQGLHEGWIVEGLRKSYNGFSNIICFETKDPERLRQLRAYLIDDYIRNPPERPEGGSRWDVGQVFWFTPWHGLTSGARTDSGSASVTCLDAEWPMIPCAADAYSSHQLETLGQALRHLDRELRQGRTAFVLSNLENALGSFDARSLSRSNACNSVSLQEKQDLLNAFRSWAYDRSIRVWQSVVILICSNASCLIEEGDMEAVVIARVPRSTDDERRAVIQERTSGSSELNISDETEACRIRDQLVMLTKGLSVHQLRCVLRDSYDTARRSFDLSRVKVVKGELISRSAALHVREPSPVSPEEAFNRVGGYGTVKEFLQREVVRALTSPGDYERNKTRPPRGVLFFGPPGTGKTLLARCLADAVSTTFIELRTEHLVSQWLGETGHRLSEAIQLVEEMSPAIVFIDEIDKFGRRRDASDSAGEETRRAFSQMLEWLGDEKRKSIVVAATNKPEELDAALKRPGRLDYKIPVLWPNEAARADILSVKLGLKSGVEEETRPPMAGRLESNPSAVVRELAEMTVMFSGADLEELVHRAKRAAAGRAVEEQDLLNAAYTYRLNHVERERELEAWRGIVATEADDCRFLRDVDELLAELAKLRLRQQGDAGRVPTMWNLDEEDRLRWSARRTAVSPDTHGS